MQYFHSNKSFNQYKPHQTFWQKLKNRRQKKEIVPLKTLESSLKNPFKKEEVKSNTKTKIIWSVFILLIIAWIGLILTIPYFKINKIIVSGNKIAKTSDIEQYVKNFHFSKTNYFLFPVYSTADNVKQAFLFENVQIKKLFPDTIQINITEKPASIIYDDNTNYYLLDNDGKLIKKINEYINISNPLSVQNQPTSTAIVANLHLTTYQQIKNNYGYFPVIYSEKTTENTNGILLSPKLIKIALDWDKQLKEQNIGEVQYFKTTETDFNLKIFINKPWYLLINTETSLSDQMQNLKIILNSNQPTEYVDVRFGERVYWK